MENPTKCFLFSVPDDDTNSNPHTLGCNRQGTLQVHLDRSKQFWDEWCLIPTEEDDASTGVVRIVHAATGRLLLCDFNGNVSTTNTKPTEDDDETTFWSLEDHDLNEGIVRIRSFAGNCYLCLEDSAAGYLVSDNKSNSGAAAITTNPMASKGTLWKVRYSSGELCYIHLSKSSSDSKSLLMCDNLGSLKLTSVFGGWEVWRFQEAGNNQVRISSWTHSNRFLACTDYGIVQTTQDRWCEESLWKIQKAPKGLYGVLIIHANTGRLLRSDGKTLTTTGYMDGVNTTWQLTAAHRQRYYLTSIGYDKRASLIKETTLKTTHYRRDCEVWSVEQTYQGTSLVLLKSDKFQRYLRYDGRGLSVSDKNAETDMTCRWRIIESPTGRGLCFVSAMEPYLALSCNAKGQLEAVDHQGPFESWNLEPCMPQSLQQWQINLMIGGALGAAVLGPAVAASMMATAGAEAGVAAAGVVAAETAVAGEVAVATGTATTLGVAGITAAIGTGAAVGLSATGIIIATSPRERGEGTDIKQTEQDRPFCEWRNWYSAVI